MTEAASGAPAKPVTPEETKPVETSATAPAETKAAPATETKVSEVATPAVAASAAAPDSSSAPSSAPAPATTAAPAATSAPASASQTLGKILGITASVLVGLLPSIPVGAVSAAATVADGALRAISEFLINKGSGNALTEAQAEAALKTLLAGLATLAAPLPTPETIESQA